LGSLGESVGRSQKTTPEEKKENWIKHASLKQGVKKKGWRRQQRGGGPSTAWLGKHPGGGHAKPGHAHLSIYNTKLKAKGEGAGTFQREKKKGSKSPTRRAFASAPPSKLRPRVKRVPRARSFGK